MQGEDGPIHQLQKIFKQQQVDLPFDKAPREYKNYMLSLYMMTQDSQSENLDSERS